MIQHRKIGRKRSPFFGVSPLRDLDEEENLCVCCKSAKKETSAVALSQTNPHKFPFLSFFVVPLFLFFFPFSTTRKRKVETISFSPLLGHIISPCCVDLHPHTHDDDPLLFFKHVSIFCIIMEEQKRHKIKKSYSLKANSIFFFILSFFFAPCYSSWVFVSLVEQKGKGEKRRCYCCSGSWYQTNQPTKHTHIFLGH